MVTDIDSWLTLCLNVSRIPALGSIAFKEAIVVSSSLSPKKARVNNPVPAPILQCSFVSPGLRRTITLVLLTRRHLMELRS